MDGKTKTSGFASLILVSVAIFGAHHLYTQSKKPETQLVFEDIIGKWRASYTDAKNDFLREPMRKQRGVELCARVPFQVVDWYGKVDRVEQTFGKVVFSVEIRNTSLYNVVSTSDVLFQQIKNLGKGDSVKFSGRFVRQKPPPEETDCFRESSLTERGSMDAPSYMFEFIRISPD